MNRLLRVSATVPPCCSHPVAVAVAVAAAAAPRSRGALSAQPSSVQLRGQNSVTLTENGYSGPITQTNNCTGIADVQPTTTGPVHATTVNVGNTEVIITGQAARRRT